MPCSHLFQPDMNSLPAFLFRIHRSGRYDAEPPDEWLGDGKLAIDNLERKRRQCARGRSIHDRCRLARIVARIVTWTFEIELIRLPAGHFAARMRADSRISDNAIGGEPLRRLFKRRR